MTRARRALTGASVVLCLAAAAPARAEVAPQPPLDISKLDYSPIGAYKPGDPIPTPTDLPKAGEDGVFNPSGHFSAYDTNVFESLNLPSRYAGDTSAKDPLGNGGAPFGFCPPTTDPGFGPYGKCDNHQLEYLDYYERTMKQLLGDFGVVVHRYKFQSPGSGTGAGPGNPGDTHTPAGDSYNIGAIVPGADNPEESIIVSGHFDFTTSGPAAAWDSSEGHAEVIRMAKIMSDYWRRTGTRPSATVKFMPWDQEESGTLGSMDFVQNNVPPGEESKIRGYFNVDPCAGAFPAFRNGDGQDRSRIPLQMQLADPAVAADAATANRFTAFNKKSEQIVDEWFEKTDDTIATPQGKRNLFVTEKEAAAGEGPADRQFVVTTIGGLLLFSSDYRNFEQIGVPFFNLSPDMFGPHADGTPASSEGIGILHSPRDNLTTINALTSTDQTGRTASEGWMKGMEMCAGLESWWMLQPEMGGAQTGTTDPVAYFEALPNEALEGQAVHFDANGSYQWSDVARRTYVDEDRLEFLWDFGDGTTGSGKTVKHAYDAVGTYDAKLTVRNRRTGKADTMGIGVTVIAAKTTPPVLAPPPAEDEDGTFPLAFTFEGSKTGLQGYLIEEAPDFALVRSDDAEGPVDRLWTASKPENPAIQPWQSTESASEPLGDRSRTGKAYWTGIARTDIRPAGEVQSGDSVLTLKESVQVPKEGEAGITYWSLFKNEGDDQGRVEVAIDDGNDATPLDWDPVDVVQAVNTAAGESDPAVCDPSQPATVRDGLVQRKVNLGQYKGRRLLVRFVLRLGGENRALSQPCGWYLDDIRVDVGTFKPIGTTSELGYEVANRAAGTYGYRVKAFYEDGIKTGASNVESVTVTRGVPRSRACVPTAAFSTVTARRAGRGVRFGIDRVPNATPAHVSILQVAKGRRVVKGRVVARFGDRTRTFTWNGRSTNRRTVTDGWYVARVSSKLGGRHDTRRIALERRGGRWGVRRSFQQRATCGTLGAVKARSPVFGGRGNAPLSVSYRLNEPATVSVVVRHGSKVVRRFAAGARPAGRLFRDTVPARRLRRGDHWVTVTAKPAGERAARSWVVARKL